ncbi:uncharacterized protein N7443_000061 [Penicillium atrosanguineum]|uniref:uncharacterized protein n=1 Tax=Penicillium atrosanguineum TaxID=1132637 RepID=UPI00239EE133|nr:uncharacterized protein N7443_000061 [Penicillium atrosanguineum]KAJ5313177.1 hypothetical protein N7443_000061 [Penicillium atrosanguineum]
MAMASSSSQSIVSLKTEALLYQHAAELIGILYAINIVNKSRTPTLKNIPYAGEICHYPQ